MVPGSELAAGTRNARQEKLRRAARVGVAQWRGGEGPERAGPETRGPIVEVPWSVPESGVIGPLPRREPLTVDTVSTISPRTMRLGAPYKAGFWLTVRRFFVWLSGVARFSRKVLWDKIRRRDSVERQAKHLHDAITRVGGTFIKFGQQAAIRVDLLPYAYCEELTKLLDRVDPFPTEQAIEAVERVTGAPLADTFEIFDPDPIGSASIACVYQAVLKDGSKVAVKVRRPGIGRVFVADFTVLGWLFRVTEFLTIVRPGFTENVLEEVRTTVLEELDFYKEARFQEIFRRRAKDARRRYFTAPKVYHEISGEDVIVEDFVSGIWLSELLAAVEHGDAAALARIDELNIDPRVVARRLLWVSYWGLWESVFFHADPHPANITIQANNKLVFIDFGAMGALKASRRATLHEILGLEQQEDLETMARVSLTLLEPLPPIDTERVIKAVEEVYWDALIANRSDGAEWWERTSAQLWLGFFRVTSRFQIPMSFDTVRMIRATLLYDTLAARLDNDIDLGHQYRQFVKDAGGEARNRLGKSTRKRLEKGPTGRDYLRAEQLIKMGEQTLYQANRLVNLRTFNFAALVGKLVESFVLTAGMIVRLVGLTAVVGFGTYLWRQAFGGDTRVGTIVNDLFTSPLFIVAIGLLAVVSVRRILFRLRDKEV